MGNEGNIFISWSGKYSQSVAEKLRSWLPYVIESPNYWVSSCDLPDGRRWVKELAERLEVSHFGILIVTPENISSPWLLFEAGALSKSISEGRVIPYLISMQKKVLSGPLSQFQALVSNEEDTRRLVESIRTVLPKPPEKNVVQKRFDMFWPELDESLREIIRKSQSKSGIIKQPENVSNDITAFRSEMAEATTIIRQLVTILTSQATKAGDSLSDQEDTDLHLLEGTWLGQNDGSHLCIRVIDGKLVAPYCYGGNDELTAEYYEWRKAGDYWFTRYRWFNKKLKGFAFYKFEDPGKLVGMWWSENYATVDVTKIEDLDVKTRDLGTKAVWLRDHKLSTPKWAQKFFQELK